MAAVAKGKLANRADDLYVRIGLFLVEQRLAPEPANYAFAHAALTGSNPALAAEVARLTDGGCRLSGSDVARLGGTAASLGDTQASSPARAAPGDDAAQRAAMLAAETEEQVRGFAGLMRLMRHETEDFGRDLAERVAALDAVRPTGMAEVSRLTSSMIRRVRESEARLAQATNEAEALRDKLADARLAARRDPLTGLANRLALSEAFAELTSSDDPCCVAICDIDRFKSINDTHGHPVGDRVLRAIGETLTQICDGHLVVRHGGEEFAILLRNVAIADAVALIDDAREAVSARRFRNRDTDAAIGRVSFSAGVTALRGSEAPDDALERADRLLYAAKAGGRDRVCAE